MKEAELDLVNFQASIYKDFSRKGKEPVITVGASVGQLSNTFIHNLNFGSFASQTKNLIANQTLGQGTMHTAPRLIMASQFAPLVFPALLHDLPQNYSQRIRLYVVDEDITA